MNGNKATDDVTVSLKRVMLVVSFILAVVALGGWVISLFPTRVQVETNTEEITATKKELALEVRALESGIVRVKGELVRHEQRPTHAVQAERQALTDRRVGKLEEIAVAQQEVLIRIDENVKGIKERITQSNPPPMRVSP